MIWVAAVILGSLLCGLGTFSFIVLTHKGHPVDVFAKGVAVGLLAIVIWLVFLYWISPMRIVITF